MDFIKYLIALIVVYILLIVVICMTIKAYKDSKITALTVVIELIISLGILLLLTSAIAYIIGTADCNNVLLTYPFK